MTGLDLERDEIIELACVVRQPNHGVVELCTTVRSAVESSADALALHGIDAREAADATEPELALAAFFQAIDGCVVVGHGVSMDLQFLRRALCRWLPKQAPIEHALDTLTLARRAVSAPSYALEALSQTLALPRRRFHRALEDARATAALFDAIAPMFAPESARDLWEVRVDQRERVRVRQAIQRQIERLASDGGAARFIVRSHGHAPRTIRGTVEHWDAPHLRVHRANAPPMPLRADRILRIEPME